MFMQQFVRRLSSVESYRRPSEVEKDEEASSKKSKLGDRGRGHVTKRKSREQVPRPSAEHVSSFINSAKTSGWAVIISIISL